MSDATTHSSTAEKLRKPVSFAIAACLLALLVTTRPAWYGTIPCEVLEQLGFLLIFLAVLGRVWCTLFIAGRKNRELCVAGPYELCRNPLYLFSFIGLLGVCLGSGSLSLTILAAAAYLLYYRGVIRGEEQRLAAIFGDAFDRYIASTPRFWPRWVKPQGNHTLQVESKIFTRSLGEVIWFLVAINLLEIIDLLKDRHLLGWFVLPL